MPAYTAIETYTRLSQCDAKASVQAFLRLLAQIGYRHASIDVWPDQIDCSEPGYVFVNPAAPWQTLDGPPALHVRPSVLGWDDILEFHISFEAERLTQEVIGYTDEGYRTAVAWQYHRAIGVQLWHWMRKFSLTFPDFGVYPTLDGSGGVPGEALIAGNGDLWQFDLALVPHDLAERFVVVPENYHRSILGYGIALARTNMWPEYPWDNKSGSA
jgi:hypothetical protein